LDMKKELLPEPNREGKIGLFEVADGGTLFLDEIGDLSLKLQVKLLEVIQDFSIMRIGGTKRKRINTRIISATNKNLEKRVEEGSFREDLYYRLNVVPIHIPPLRERKEDIPPLVNHFLKKFNSKYKKDKFLSREVTNCLMNYNWPGNVRELSNLIERMVIIPTTNLIGVDQLPPQIAKTNQETKEYPLQLSKEMSLKEIREQFETHVIEEAIKRYGTAQMAARALQVNPSTISRKIRRQS
jgi:transcriptional regulator with PAS, ATPase and Fis domain